MIAATALRMDNAYPYKIHRPNRLKENNVRYFKKKRYSTAERRMRSFYIRICNIYNFFFFVCLFIIRFDAPRFLLLLFFFLSFLIIVISFFNPFFPFPPRSTK